MAPRFVILVLAPSVAASHLGIIVTPITPTVVKATRIHPLYIVGFVMMLAPLRMVFRFAQTEAAPLVLVILVLQTVIQIPPMVVRST